MAKVEEYDHDRQSDQKLAGDDFLLFFWIKMFEEADENGEGPQESMTIQNKNTRWKSDFQEKGII